MARYTHSKTKQGGPDRLMVTFSPSPTGGYSIKKNGADAIPDDFTAILEAPLSRNIEAVVADSDDGSNISVDSVDGDVDYGYSSGYLGLSDEDAGSFDGDVDQYSSSVMESSAIGSSLDNPVDLVDDDEDSFAGVEDHASHLSIYGTTLVNNSPSVSSTAESYRLDTLFNSRDEATSGVAPDATDDLSDVDSIPSSDFLAVDSVDSRVGTPFGNSLNASDSLSGVNSIPSFDFPLTDSADEALLNNFSSGSSVTLDDDTTHQEIDAIDAKRMAANKAHWDITRNLLDEASQLTRENNSLRASAAYQKQLYDAAIASEAKCRTTWADRERLVDEASICLTSAANMIIENSGADDAIREVVPLIHLAVHGNLKLGGAGGDLVAAVGETWERMKTIREKKCLEEAEQSVHGGIKRPAGDDQVHREAKVCRCSGYAWEERNTPEQFEDEQVSLLCLREMRSKEDSDDEDVFEDALGMQ